MLSGVSGQFYLLLGDIEKAFAPLRFLGFDIYLHDKGILYCLPKPFKFFFCDLGQFWPGLEMGRTGLSDVFFLPKDIEWDGSFVMTEKTLIDTTDIPCQKVII